MKVLVTGAAGFIGMHVVAKLCARGDEVTGLDDINDYYDVSLKHDRLAQLGLDAKNIAWNAPINSAKLPGLRFVRLKLEDEAGIEALFVLGKFDAVCNLGAQAGVRYSLKAPLTYVSSNVTGFVVLAEACVRHHIKHLVYASTSSVYGLNSAQPFAENNGTAHPASLYAATKKANELLAHTYSHIYKLPTTGLRFFTVYGPWGRPDMAPYLFTSAILEGRTITLFNHGNMKRDFTFIDDIASGVVKVIDKPAVPDPDWNSAAPDPSRSSAPYRIYNIGRGNAVELRDFLSAIEHSCGKKAIVQEAGMQSGDVPSTWADTEKLERDFGWKPVTDMQQGIQAYVDWFTAYYRT